MLFTADAYEGLVEGTITVTFRHWTRPQVKVGGSYKIPRKDITLVVDDLRQLPAADIGDADARRAGETDRHGVWRRLGGPPPGGPARHGRVARRVPPPRPRARHRAAPAAGRPRPRRRRRGEAYLQLSP